MACNRKQSSLGDTPIEKLSAGHQCSVRQALFGDGGPGSQINVPWWRKRDSVRSEVQRPRPTRLELPAEWAQRLAGMQCPFTWEQCQPLDEDDLAVMKDHLPFLTSDFSVVAKLVLMSFSHHCGGRHSEARGRLADAYAMLLPQLDRGCCTVRDYREALRHVLDATWAGLLAAAGGDDSLLRAFIKRIKPFTRLSRRQQAAVVAVQSTCLRQDDANEAAMLLRKAIKLAPKESEWLLMLAANLQIQRDCKNCCSRHEDVHALIADAYRLRPTALAAMSLAKSFASSKDAEEQTRARKLLHEALKLSPDHPGMIIAAISVKAKMLKKSKARAVHADAEVEALRKRALAAAADRRMLFLITYYLGDCFMANNWRERAWELYEDADIIDTSAFDAILDRDIRLSDSTRKIKCLKTVSHASEREAGAAKACV